MAKQPVCGPSLQEHPDPFADGGYVLGIDIGGTNLKMGIADMSGSFVFKKVIPSKRIGFGGPVVSTLAHLVEQTLTESGIPRGVIRGVGLAVPGVTDPLRGTVSHAPAFGWEDLPIRDLLSAKLDLPVYVENDVNAAALAEKEWGAGRGLRDFVYINIGTGIGAGLILDGRLYRGHLHAAGEVGYTIVDLHWLRQKKDHPDGFGCLESLAGARGIVKRAEELGGLIRWKQAASGHTAEHVFDAARDGDPVALRMLDEVTDYLAVGIINITAIISPEAVIIGGGVSRAGETLFAPLRAKFNQWSPIRPRILQSSFYKEPGLAGAAFLAASLAKENTAV